MSVGNLSSFFQMPEFRAGQPGFNFSGSPLGTPSFIGSVPTYADNAASVRPLSTSSSSMAIDPLSAGLGIASIGTSIAGLFGQKSAAEQQADAVEEAARQQAQAVKQASKTGAQLQLAEFGLNYLRDRDAFGAGGAGDRFNEALNISQRANIEANNPSLAALRSIARYEDRLSRAMPGYTPPSALFS
jgi:hypothetical protein